MCIAKHNYPTHEKKLDDNIKKEIPLSNVFSPTSIPKKDITLIGNMFVNFSTILSIILYYGYLAFFLSLSLFFLFDFYESFECFVFLGGEK
jgi:hypothetical protein